MMKTYKERKKLNQRKIRLLRSLVDEKEKDEFLLGVIYKRFDGASIDPAYQVDFLEIDALNITKSREWYMEGWSNKVDYDYIKVEGIIRGTETYG